MKRRTTTKGKKGNIMKTTKRGKERWRNKAKNKEEGEERRNMKEKD